MPVKTSIVFTSIYFEPYCKFLLDLINQYHSLFTQNSSTCPRYSKPTWENSGQCLEWNPYRNVNQNSATAALTKNKRKVKADIYIFFGGDVTIFVYLLLPYVKLCHFVTLCHFSHSSGVRFPWWRMYVRIKC